MVEKKKNGKNTYMAKTVSVHPFATIGSTTVARNFVLIILNVKLIIIGKLKRFLKKVVITRYIILKIKQLLLRLLRSSV